MTRKVGDGNVTCFDIRYAVFALDTNRIYSSFMDVLSADGKFLAFGSSDLTIGFLDAVTLKVSNISREYLIFFTTPVQPLVNILKAHEFPPTTIAFNPTTTLLVSGSADNTIRIIAVPESVANTSCAYAKILTTKC